MAREKDINSTERLLNVIRGAQMSSDEQNRSEQPHRSRPKPGDKFSVHFPRMFAGRQRAIVGVDIGREDILLAKITRSLDGKPLLVDQQIIKTASEISRDSERFRELLKTQLASFAGAHNGCDVWAMMNAADVSVQHLKIPVVPRKQLENVIYWTARKENPIDEKDAIFDYEMQGEIIDQGIPKYSVMVYSAYRSEIEKIRNLFLSIGVALAGITIAPFAIQNLFRTKWINVAEETCASIYIGHDYSRIDIFHKSNLSMTRGIKTGISSLMESIDETLAETHPGQNIDKAKLQTVLQEMSSRPEQGFMDEAGLLWTKDQLRNMIAPALERLTRQIERTLEHYANAVGYQKVEKVYISSVQNDFHEYLMGYLGEQLATPCETLNPMQSQPSSPAGGTMTIAQKAAFAPVIGLALSDRKLTPNAIFTYVDKNSETRRKRINRGIFAAFGVALAVCLVILVFQVVETTHLSAKRARLEKQLSQYSPILSKDQIAALAGEQKTRYQINQQYAAKYKGMAVISELSLLTPDHIRLTGMHINLAPTATGKAKDSKEQAWNILLEGVVTGERNAQDALLAQYVMRLEHSPILQNVSLQKSQPLKYKKKDILRFTIQAKIG